MLPLWPCWSSDFYFSRFNGNKIHKLPNNLSARAGARKKKWKNKQKIQKCSIQSSKQVEQSYILCNLTAPFKSIKFCLIFHSERESHRITVFYSTFDYGLFMNCDLFFFSFIFISISICVCAFYCISLYCKLLTTRIVSVICACIFFSVSHRVHCHFFTIPLLLYIKLFAVVFCFYLKLSDWSAVIPHVILCVSMSAFNTRNIMHSFAWWCSFFFFFCFILLYYTHSLSRTSRVAHREYSHTKMTDARQNKTRKRWERERKQ